MSRKLRRRRVGAVAVVAALATLGAIDVMLVSSGRGAAPVRAVPVAAQVPSAAPSQVVPSPTQPGPEMPSAPAATASVPPVAPETPPPVVDGVRRTNVGSAHSPQLLQQLSASPVTMPRPADAGALGIDVADHQHPDGAAIDWSQVAAAGYKFAFIKATEGDYYDTRSYPPAGPRARAPGLYATGYHFAIPNVGDGASQADFALANG